MSNSQEQLNDVDRTCAMCHKRQGVATSTANRWFCQPCMDSLSNDHYVENLEAEIRRLQAIEQQNEELRKVIDRQHIQLDKYESLLNEGVNDHE